MRFRFGDDFTLKIETSSESSMCKSSPNKAKNEQLLEDFSNIVSHVDSKDFLRFLVQIRDSGKEEVDDLVDRCKNLSINGVDDSILDLVTKLKKFAINYEEVQEEVKELSIRSHIEDVQNIYREINETIMVGDQYFNENKDKRKSLYTEWHSMVNIANKLINGPPETADIDVCTELLNILKETTRQFKLKSDSIKNKMGVKKLIITNNKDKSKKMTKSFTSSESEPEEEFTTVDEEIDVDSLEKTVDDVTIETQTKDIGISFSKDSRHHMNTFMTKKFDKEASLSSFISLNQSEGFSIDKSTPKSQLLEPFVIKKSEPVDKECQTKIDTKPSFLTKNVSTFSPITTQFDGFTFKAPEKPPIVDISTQKPPQFSSFPTQFGGFSYKAQEKTPTDHILAQKHPQQTIIKTEESGTQKLLPVSSPDSFSAALSSSLSDSLNFNKAKSETVQIGSLKPSAPIPPKDDPKKATAFPQNINDLSKASKTESTGKNLESLIPTTPQPFNFPKQTEKIVSDFKAPEKPSLFDKNVLKSPVSQIPVFPTYKKPDDIEAKIVLDSTKKRDISQEASNQSKAIESKSEDIPLSEKKDEPIPLAKSDPVQSDSNISVDHAIKTEPISTELIESSQDASSKSDTTVELSETPVEPEKSLFYEESSKSTIPATPKPEISSQQPAVAPTFQSSTSPINLNLPKTSSSDSTSAIPTSNMPPTIPASNAPSTIPASNAPPTIPASNEPPTIPASNAPRSIPISDTPPAIPTSHVSPVIPASHMPPVIPTSQAAPKEVKIMEPVASLTPAKNVFSTTSGMGQVETTPEVFSTSFVPMDTEMQEEPTAVQTTQTSHPFSGFSHSLTPSVTTLHTESFGQASLSAFSAFKIPTTSAAPVLPSTPSFASKTGTVPSIGGTSAFPSFNQLSQPASTASSINQNPSSSFWSQTNTTNSFSTPSSTSFTTSLQNTQVSGFTQNTSSLPGSFSSFSLSSQPRTNVLQAGPTQSFTGYGLFQQPRPQVPTLNQSAPVSSSALPSVSGLFGNFGSSSNQQNTSPFTTNFSNKPFSSQPTQSSQQNVMSPTASPFQTSLTGSFNQPLSTSATNLQPTQPLAQPTVQRTGLFSIPQSFNKLTTNQSSQNQQGSTLGFGSVTPSTTRFNPMPTSFGSFSAVSSQNTQAASTSKASQSPYANLIAQNQQNNMNRFG